MPVTILLLAAVLFGNLITAGIIAPLASDGNKPRVSTNRDDFETMVYVHNGQNHSLVPASWKGSLFKDSPEITLYAKTLFEIIDYIEAQNPNFDTDFPSPYSDKTPHYDDDDMNNIIAAVHYLNSPADDPGFTQFVHPNDVKVVCGQYMPAFCDHGGPRGYGPLWEAVNYLKRHNKVFAIPGAEKRICWRLTCSWDTEVFFCNDTPTRDQRVDMLFLGYLLEYLLRFDCTPNYNENGKPWRSVRYHPEEFFLGICRSVTHC